MAPVAEVQSSLVAEEDLDKSALIAEDKSALGTSLLTLQRWVTRPDGRQD